MTLLKTIRNKSLIIFSALAILFIGVMSVFTLDTITSNVIDQELGEMKGILVEKQLRVQTLHDRASEDLVFALKNPAFAEYFELPETKAGNKFDDNNVMQFTDNQRQIKIELEQWIWNFQNKFQVDETCIIDTTGQEHARLVLQKIEADEFLSPDEKETPFFAESFEKGMDEVHVEYPYVSPDTDRWVFAYTSPVVLGLSEKPAIYHFEMPITVFQDMITINHGRMYVLDPHDGGYVMADSHHDYSENTSDVFEDHFPSSDSIVPQELLSEMQTNEKGVAKYESDGGDIYHVAYVTIPPFDWILVYEEPQSLMLEENNTIFGSMTNTTITIVTLGIVVGAIVVTLLIANRITSAMIALDSSRRRRQ